MLMILFGVSRRCGYFGRLFAAKENVLSCLQSVVADKAKRRLPLKYYPHYATLQRAVDGWAWYTSNVGQLMPHFEEIEVQDQKEPLPAIWVARFYTWDEISGELLNSLAKERDEEQNLPPLVQVTPDAEMDLPPAPSGPPLKRKIEGSLSLPEPMAEDVQRYAEEQDQRLWSAHDLERPEELAQKLEEETPFPPLAGVTSFASHGLPDALGSVLEKPAPDLLDDNEDTSSEIEAGSGRIAQPDPEHRERKEEEETPTRVGVDPEEVQQPIPFRMGLTPQPDEVPPGDELTD